LIAASRVAGDAGEIELLVGLHDHVEVPRGLFYHSVTMRQFGRQNLAQFL